MFKVFLNSVYHVSSMFYYVCFCIFIICLVCVGMFYGVLVFISICLKYVVLLFVSMF